MSLQEFVTALEKEATTLDIDDPKQAERVQRVLDATADTETEQVDRALDAAPEPDDSWAFVAVLTPDQKRLASIAANLSALSQRPDEMLKRHPGMKPSQLYRPNGPLADALLTSLVAAKMMVRSIVSLSGLPAGCEDLLVLAKGGVVYLRPPE